VRARPLERAVTRVNDIQANLYMVRASLHLCPQRTLGWLGVLTRGGGQADAVACGCDAGTDDPNIRAAQGDVRILNRFSPNFGTEAKMYSVQRAGVSKSMRSRGMTT